MAEFNPPSDPQGDWGQGSVNNGDTGFGAGSQNSPPWGFIHQHSYGHAITNLVGGGGVSSYALQFLSVDRGLVEFDTPLSLNDFTIRTKVNNYVSGYIVGTNSSLAHGIYITGNSIIVRISAKNYQILTGVNDPSGSDLVISRVGSELSVTLNGGASYTKTAVSDALLLERLGNRGNGSPLEGLMEYFSVDGVLDYELNEGTGIIANDTSGNGNNGTLGTVATGLPTWVQI